MKANAIVRIILWSLVIIVLLGILGVNVFRSVRTTVRNEILIDEHTSDSESKQPAQSGTAVSIRPEQMERIAIEWAAGTITLESSDVSEIIFVETTNGGRAIDPEEVLVYELKNGELKIQFCKENLFGLGVFNRSTYEKDLNILVPQEWVCEDLEIDAAAAWVSVSDMTIGTVDFDGASGECEFVNCSVNEMDLDTASGDIRFSGTLNDLDCDAASASIYAELRNIPRNLDLDSMSGDLEILLPEDAGFTLSMDALDSDFSSDFETTLRNGSYVSGSGHCRINVDALSGNVCIRKHSHGAASAGGHLHTDACQSDPASCPDNHHEHTDTCQSDPASCPDNHHTHTDTCQSDPASCPDYHHTHTDTCQTNPDTCPDTSHNSGTHKDTGSHSDKHGH